MEQTLKTFKNVKSNLKNDYAAAFWIFNFERTHVTHQLTNLYKFNYFAEFSYNVGRVLVGINAFYLRRVFANKLTSTSCYTAARVWTQKYYFAITRRYHTQLFLFDFCTVARNAESRDIARSAIFPGHGYRYRYWRCLCWLQTNIRGT